MTQQSEIEEIASRVEATIHRINGHWWNRRRRPEAPDLRALIDQARAAYEVMARSDGEGVRYLRRLLSVARPYISDRAGAGIISAIDSTLQHKGTAP
jgi:hypothetical protein